MEKVEYSVYFVPVPIGNRADITLRALDVLRKVKKLWGPMDDYFMQAHGGLFLLSGAIDDLPEEEFPEHFGMTKQDFEDEYGD